MARQLHPLFRAAHRVVLPYGTRFVLPKAGLVQAHDLSRLMASYLVPWRGNHRLILMIIITRTLTKQLTLQLYLEPRHIHPCIPEKDPTPHHVHLLHHSVHIHQYPPTRRPFTAAQPVPHPSNTNPIHSHHPPIKAHQVITMVLIPP